eukprot:m.338675 g.338675  ORF g.338675 m.338675 type:complete len:52 (-) comp18500_c0_seq1:179-334(-)
MQCKTSIMKMRSPSKTQKNLRGKKSKCGIDIVLSVLRLNNFLKYIIGVFAL